MAGWITKKRGRQTGPRKNQWRGSRAHQSESHQSEARRARSQARRTRLLRCAGVAVAIALGGWGLAISLQHAAPMLQRLLEVRHVTVDGLRRVPKQEVIDKLALPDGVTLYQIAPADVARRIESHPWVRQATVTRVPFHELRVSILERKAAAVVHTDSENFLTDQEGRLLASLGPNDDHTLPELTGIDLEGFFHGDAGTRRTITSGVELARLVAGSLEGRLSIDARNPLNLVASVRGVQFQFGDADMGEQWERFQRVRPSIKTLRFDGRGRGPSEVDLRYDNRVILRERG